MLAVLKNILTEQKADLDWQLPGCPSLAGDLKGRSGAPRQTVPMPGGQRQTDGADAGPVPASHTCTYRHAQSAVEGMNNQYLIQKQDTHCRAMCYALKTDHSKYESLPSLQLIMHRA